MRTVRQICCIKLQDRVPSKGLKERLRLDDIISVVGTTAKQVAMLWVCVCCEKKTMIG